MPFSPAFFTSVINGYLPEPHASLLNGIIFGIPLRSSAIFYAQLKTTGLLHMVVLSGMNISMLASLIETSLSFLQKKITVFVTIGFIICFVLFVGPAPSIVRAAIMSICSLIAVLFGKQYTSLWGLLFAVIFIGLISPGWLTKMSFHLSFGATLGIILFGPKNKNTNTLLKGLQTTFAAQLFTAPLIFLSFKQLSLISPLSNLLIAPFVPPLMIFGFCAAILGKIHLSLGIIPAGICYGILSYMVITIRLLSRIPFALISFN